MRLIHRDLMQGNREQIVAVILTAALLIVLVASVLDGVHAILS
jgi:hypothetical protein